jgi:protein-S-isoprenylcysteine O-methyltransferase Ste14
MLSPSGPPQTQSSAEDTPLQPAISNALVAAEKYLLPLIFAYLALQRFNYLETQYTAYQSLVSSPLFKLHFSHGVFFADFTKNLLLLILLLFNAVTLLINSAPSAPPDKLKHILVPIAGSYYLVLYGYIHYFPLWMRQSIFPDTWRTPGAIAALLCSIAGYSIAIWAMIYLKRSFAVFVSVRDVITRGPYRLVRHPIYFGYLLDITGLLLSAGSLAMFILVTGHIALLICRARMEEQMLAAAYPAYRLYLARTGFLFPRLRANRLSTTATP